MNNDRFIRKYKLTIGTPLSFYSSDVAETPFADISESKIRGFSVEDRIKYENNFTNSRFLYDKFSTDSFNAIEIEDLHIDFHIEEAEGEDTSYITIYNASEKTLGYFKNIGKLPTAVKLECGYITDKELPLIFQGEATHIVDKFEGATRQTKIIVKSGASNIKEAYSIRAYKKGTTLEKIVKDLISDMKLPYGTVYIPRVNENAIAIDRNFYANGKTWDTLKTLVGQFDLKVLIARTAVNVFPSSGTDQLKPANNEVNYQQDLLSTRGFSSNLIDTREIVSRQQRIQQEIDAVDNRFPERKGYKLTTEQGILISNKDSTLIGYPAQENGNSVSLELQGSPQERIRIKTLMNGSLTVGKKIALESRFYNGVYNIEKVIFKGQFEGQDWYVECVCALAESYSVKGV